MQDAGLGDSHIDIMDKIYTKENVKIAKKISKLREALAMGISIREKTVAEETLEELENRVLQKYRLEHLVSS